MVRFGPGSCRAAGRFGDFIHDGAVGMAWSHFVRAKGDAGDYIESRFPSIGSLRNGMAETRVSYFYPLPESVEFAAISLQTLPRSVLFFCKWRAEWMFMTVPRNRGSRPNLWTVRVTAM